MGAIMSTVRTISNLSFRLAALASVLVWLWMLVGFHASGSELAMYRIGILGLGVLLSIVLMVLPRSGHFFVLGASYAMVFGFLFGMAGQGTGGSAGIQTVEIAIDGYPAEREARVLAQDEIEARELFETLVARTASFDTPAFADASAAAVQTVGRSEFSPMDLGF